MYCVTAKVVLPTFLKLQMLKICFAKIFNIDNIEHIDTHYSP